MRSRVTRGCALAILVAKAITGCQSSDQGAGDQSPSDASTDVTIGTDANISSDAALEGGAPSIVLGPVVQLLNPGDLGLDQRIDNPRCRGFGIWLGRLLDL